MNIKFTALLILILLVSIGITIKMIEANSVLKMEKEQLVDYTTASDAQAEWYKNELGKETARIKVLELSSRNAKDLKADKKFNVVKSFKGVKENLRNLEAMSTTSLLYYDTVVIDVPRCNDSTVVDKEVIICKDSTKLTGAALWHKKWFLGKKRWTFDVSSSNPKFKITGLEYIRIGKR